MRACKAAGPVIGTALAVWGLGAAAGCYEETAPAPQQAAAAQPSDPGAGGGSYGQGATPSHGAAKRAAENTVEQLDEHQREIEKAINDPP